MQYLKQIKLKFPNNLQMRMKKSKSEMRKEFLQLLHDLEKLPIKRTFERVIFSEPATKLGTLIASSTAKVEIINEELLSAILDRKFFTSLSLLRMLFEEVILITFTLSKLEKSKNLENADHILTRIAVGLKTKLRVDEHIEPYNIHTTLEEAEHYIELKDSKLKGIFEETYTFISEYVHPNAPSRYHFNRTYGSKVRITKVSTTEDDLKMILNYACMALGLYLYVMKPLLKVDISNLPDK